MNGRLTECTECDCDPCCCKEIVEREQIQRIKEGKIVIESLQQAIIQLPRWRIKIIRRLWPDIIKVVDDLKEYYIAGLIDDSLLIKQIEELEKDV